MLDTLLTVIVEEGRIMVKFLKVLFIVFLATAAIFFFMIETNEVDRVKLIRIESLGEVVQLKNCTGDKSKCVLITDRTEIVLGDWEGLDRFDLKPGHTVQIRVAKREYRDSVSYCIQGTCMYHSDIIRIPLNTDSRVTITF